MSMENLTDLMKHELGDLLYAENHILKGLKKMGKEVKDPVMNQRMMQHRDETEGHVENLKAAFEALGFKAKAEKCPGILGLIEEHDEFKEEEEPNEQMLEAFDLGSGLRIEHYEIAAYKTSIAIARALGNAEVERLLNENLRQEIEMEKFLTTNAIRSLKKLERDAAAASAEAE